MSHIEKLNEVGRAKDKFIVEKIKLDLVMGITTILLWKLAS
jgi:hypothetical protein